MANISNVITITQLPSIGTNFTVNTALPVVNTANVGNYITDQASLGNMANYILTQAGNTLQPAFVANLAYAVTNAAQPNITSLGTLSVDTLQISGGLNGYFLQTDGNGNVAWVAGGGSGNGVVGGSNGQIQFNNSGAFGGSPNLIYNASNSTLSTANISALQVTVTGNVAAVDVTASGNITTGNLTTGNFTANGNLTANHFIGNGSLLTGITATANGAGPNTAVQYNANGVFAGDANFAYDYANHVLNVNTANINHLNANISQANHFTGEGGNLSNIQGANVNGAVGLATYAGTANAVAVANVIGIGNIATVALNGSSSQVLYGNGQWAATASSYGNSNVAAFLENYGSNTITTTGNVTTGLLTVPASDNGSIVFSDNGTDNNGSLKVDGGLNMTLSANSNFYVKQAGQDRLAITDGNTDLMASTNVVIHSNKAGTENKWIFDSSGNLSLPGSANYQVPGLGSNGHFDINSWYPVNISTGDGVNDAVSTWNFGYNGTLSFPNNFASIYTDTGANQLNIGAGGDGGGYVTINATTDTGIGGSQNVFIQSNFSGNGYIWKFDYDGNLTLPSTSVLHDGVNSGVTLTVNHSPIEIVITGADFSAVNRIYTPNPIDNTSWIPAGYNPVTDPYIQYSGSQWGIFVPGFGQALYINTGSIIAPLAQWSINPPLGSFAPTGTYTYSNPAYSFGSDGNLTTPGAIVTGNGSGGNISGVDFITANYFYGDGSNITNVPISWTTAPVSNTSSGVQGQVAYDSGGNLFICVATNIWSKITGTISW